jgi:hypothetical protein
LPARPGRLSLHLAPFGFTLSLFDAMEPDQLRSTSPTLNEDDRELETFGYASSFKREFSNLATVRSCAARPSCTL